MKQTRKPAGNPAYRTEQESFWAGSFGNAYIARNRSDQLHAGNLALFGRILQRAVGASSFIEWGANIGMNLRAILALRPGACCTGVEINEKAARTMGRLRGVRAVHASLLEHKAEPHDFAFTKGVLIHVNPDELPRAYDQLARSGRRYVAIMEYYNPSPVEIPYRGHSGRLFKRDFAGEFMARHREFRLLDYGFIYRADPVFPQDDITWFLMQRTEG